MLLNSCRSFSTFAERMFCVWIFIAVPILSLSLNAAEVPVGVLKSGDYLVELFTSEQGAVYTIKDTTGRTLAEEISKYEMVSQFPHLKHIVEGVADDASLHGPATNDRYDAIIPKH